MATLIGPTKTPQDFGFQPGDHHVIVNDVTGKAKAYNSDGKVVWTIAVRAQGTAGPDWRDRNADTPPGLYRLGKVYKDWDQYGANADYDRTLMSFGWYSFDMIGLEGQEGPDAFRDGIMWHGGGSALGWPGAWLSRAAWLPVSHGCLRSHNEDLRDKLLVLYKKGRVYVSVYQDAP